MRLFGSLLIARYGVAALGRQRVAPDARTPHTLYVDEVQNFDTSALRGIPAEGRKFGLQITMATQYLRAPRGRVAERHPRQRGHRHAAPALARGRPPARRFGGTSDRARPVNLPRFRMAIRTELAGETAVLTADVLPEPARTGNAALVRRLSDARDGRPVVSQGQR